MTARPDRSPLLSIICVFNNLDVRVRCLDRSMEASTADPEVEVIVVDNRHGNHPSAGHALNHGAAGSSGEVLAFVQQDVYIHSVDALKRAARELLTLGQLGMVGAVGVDHDGRTVGRMRDRVVLIGSSVRNPTVVDSVDEVLFMVRRGVWTNTPLAADRELAWHAYAVEYGLRLRRKGLLTSVVDIPITHNSLTANVAGLSEAHAAVARRYVDALPVVTTRGIIRPPAVSRMASAVSRVIAPHRWRYRWLRKSLVASRAALATGSAVVLSDVRRDVDRLIPDHKTLRIINLERQSSDFAGRVAAAPITLQRGRHLVEFHVASPAQLPSILRDHTPGEPLLLTNLEMGDLRSLAQRSANQSLTIGLHEGIGFWALIGSKQAAGPEAWPSRSLPAGARIWFRLARSQSAGRTDALS